MINHQTIATIPPIPLSPKTLQNLTDSSAAVRGPPLVVPNLCPCWNTLPHTHPQRRTKIVRTVLLSAATVSRPSHPQQQSRSSLQLTEQTQLLVLETLSGNGVCRCSERVPQLFDVPRLCGWAANAHSQARPAPQLCGGKKRQPRRHDPRPVYSITICFLRESRAFFFLHVSSAVRLDAHTKRKRRSWKVQRPRRHSKPDFEFFRRQWCRQYIHPVLLPGFCHPTVFQAALSPSVTWASTTQYRYGRFGQTSLQQAPQTRRLDESYQHPYPNTHYFSYLSSSLAASVALSLKHTNPNLTGATISNLSKLQSEGRGGQREGAHCMASSIKPKDKLRALESTKQSLNKRTGEEC